MGGRAAKQKGYRVENELVKLHLSVGIPCERVPLSGGQGGSFSGDLQIGMDEFRGPFLGEVKARADGAGFKVLERWLGENDFLFLRRDRTEPLVVMRMEEYLDLLACFLEYQKEHRND